MDTKIQNLKMEMDIASKDPLFMNDLYRCMTDFEVADSSLDIFEELEDSELFCKAKV